MARIKTFLESLTDPKKKKKKKNDNPPPPPKKTPWEGKAGSYFERGEDKKKRLDEAFE